MVSILRKSMADIFVDANVLMALTENKPNLYRQQLGAHNVFISPLSVHILAYVQKLSMPHPSIESLLEHFSLVDLTHVIVTKASAGPMRDMEDNIQLHSAATANCDYFLTGDKELLKMAFFGKTRVVSSLGEWEAKGGAFT